jgi:MOSC domain-containing protein YiiM
VDVVIEALLVSAIHAYEGRPADGPRPDPVPVLRERVEVRAGLGLVGDRYFAHPAHRRAAVTVFAAESLDPLATDLGLPGVPDAALARRNIVLRGARVDDLVGREFSLDSGEGPVRFRGHRPAQPCRWMDVVIGPGAWKALRGRGGVRCEPVDDGWLRLGPATLQVLGPSP